MITGKLAQPVSVNTGSKVYFVLTAQTIQGVKFGKAPLFVLQYMSHVIKAIFLANTSLLH